MPSLDIFTQLGLMVVRNFLDPKLCVQLVAEMTPAPSMPGALVRGVDETVRKVKVMSIATAGSSQVDTRFHALLPELESHFHLKLQAWEEPNFLTYQPGGFYKAHADSSPNNETRVRRVSVVIFLNGESIESQPGSYVGGALTFYGLLKGPMWERCGLPLQGTPGLLVAFPSSVVHRVEPVTYGTRHTVVAWYF